MDTTLIRSIANMIDHALLHPTLTDSDLRDGCALALHYDVASVCVKPYAIPLAAELLAGSDVRVGSVIGFPHGSNATIVKVAETVQACRDGAVEIDMVVNIGKVLSADWSYVEAEIRTVHETCLANGAILKVIFENDFLTDDSAKIYLCTLCSAVGVEFVKTSTGFGFVKGPDGTHNTAGATLPDLQLMLDHVGPTVQVKASGGIRTLDDLLTVKSIGVTRVGTSSTAAIMEEAHRRFGDISLSVFLDASRSTDNLRDVGY